MLLTCHYIALTGYLCIPWHRFKMVLSVLSAFIHVQGNYRCVFDLLQRWPRMERVESALTLHCHCVDLALLLFSRYW